MTDPSVIELGNTAAWLDLLYGKCSADDGYLVVVSSQRNRPVAVHSIAAGADLVAAAKDMHLHAGCYLKINLMDWEAIRKRSAVTRKPALGGIEEVKTVVSFHLDVDAGKDARYPGRRMALWALGEMPKKPTLIINSNGDSGGFHAYWVLKQPLRIKSDEHRQQIQDQANVWRNCLSEHLDGRLDSTANLDRFLRAVGVPRPGGGRVCMHQYHPERLYSMEDLTVETSQD